MRLPAVTEWLLFDAVGTLIYPDPPVAAAYAAAAQRHGSRLTADEIESRFRVALAAHSAAGGPTSEAHERNRWQNIVAATIDDVPTQRTQQLFEELWNHFAQPHHWRLYDDVARALDALSARGYRLAVASNFDRRLLGIVAGHAPLAALQHVFVSSELGHCKPSPEFFRAIERRLAAQPQQIALVGDDELQDIHGAKAAGWRALLLTRHACSSPRSCLTTLAELL